ncbi:MurR/RpiR family transcriptional regulator [Microbispora sp. NPDC049125]|uniref:MurR/RpiR family transcriptional regulator n=1 Tax=Microbispora sp. NPDC049125 TaxID=3154929 RepID=UPI003465A9BE
MRTDDAGSRLLRLFEGRRLTPAQRRIAHCLVQHAAEAPFLSSVEVAELAGVSQPSVTRFATALGFDGYPGLRRRLREVGVTAPPAGSAGGPAHDPAGNPWHPPRTGAPPNELQRAVLAEIENLRSLAGLLADPEPVARAARLLAASRPLPVLGLRAAAAQAAGFAYFAAKVHPDVRLLDEGGSMLDDRIEQAATAGATALLCFALPRHPAELVSALTTAKDAGLSVVTVADSLAEPVNPDVAGLPNGQTSGETGGELGTLSDVLLTAAVGTGLVFDTACAPMLLGRVLLERMCDELPGAQSRLEAFELSAARRGLFLG